MSSTSTRVTVGKVLTVLASVVGPPAAAFAAFVAAITWSGCFIECSSYDDGDRTTGALLGLLAVALLLAAPVLAATLVRRWTWVLGAIAVPVLEVLLLLAH